MKSALNNAELKKYLLELKDENFQLKSIIQNLPGSIYWKNKAGVYLGRNKTSADSLREMNFLWREEDVIGKTDYDLFPKEMADSFRKHDIEVMQSACESTREEIAFLASGKKHIQLSTKRPLYNEAGEIVGVVGNTIDITYLKNIEAGLREAKEKAEQANIIKAEFIRNMEHDIRTPICGIKGLVDYLWQQEKDKKKKELLEHINNSVKELLDYSNSILDFSKIEHGTLPILKKKFNLSQLITSTINIELPAAKHKELTLTVDFDNNIPPVLIGDDYRLQRILINLLSNAIKFTHKGSVKLVVEQSVRENNNLIILKFIVEDTGIGIPIEKQNFIYEKFARISPSNKGIYEGAGLGLSIVKQFIEEMEGEIDLESEIDKGSKFICTIPFELPLVNKRGRGKNGVN